MTSVLLLPQRQTVLVAKQAAALDVLSGGRLRLGVGVGRNWMEYEALNEQFTNRGKRIEEQVEVLRRLWTEELVTFDGAWHHLDRVGINPLPRNARSRSGWGRSSATSSRRCSNVSAGSPTDGCRSSRPTTTSRPRSTGCAAMPSPPGVIPTSSGSSAYAYPADDDPQRWHDDASAYRALGATHLKVATSGRFDTLDDLRDCVVRWYEVARGPCEHACRCEAPCENVVHERVMVTAMRAARLHEIGGTLQIDEIDDPVPADGEVVVDIDYASVNPLDIWVTRGAPGVAAANLPWIPGTEGERSSRRPSRCWCAAPGSV